MKVFFIVLLMSISNLAASQEYTVTGKITAVLINSFDLPGFSDTEDRNSIRIETNDNSGNCFKNGSILSLYLKGDENGDRQFAIIVSAMTAEKQVTVKVDDTIIYPSNSVCMLQHVQLVE
ncbi:hypothetical protein [Aliikangiella sp. IMCC44359]|uniref:hypothetical protein n=1 Tax=Aliikangiella sp. IMCC44359 TaxID=3459125 RepID=UPI00403AA411